MTCPTCSAPLVYRNGAEPGVGTPPMNASGSGRDRTLVCASVYRTGEHTDEPGSDAPTCAVDGCSLRAVAEIDGRPLCHVHAGPPPADREETTMPDLLSVAASAAFAAGHERGAASASWVELDSADAARRILSGYEDGDPEMMDLCPSPLSGEWAGESIPELSASYEIDLEDPDVADEFSAGFGEGFWDTLCDRVRAQLPTAADLLSEAGFTGYRWDGRSLGRDAVWTELEAPGPGESASFGNFQAYGASTHFEMPVTLWGDYCGSAVGRSNHRSLLREFPESFVEVSGGHFSRVLFIPVTLPLEQVEALIEIGTGLAEQYPLFDDEDHSALEMELAEEAWDAYLRFDLPRSLRDAGVSDDVVDGLDESDLRERFYTLVSEGDSCPYCESADSVVFPNYEDIVATLVEHYGAPQA